MTCANVRKSCREFAPEEGSTFAQERATEAAQKASTLSLQQAHGQRPNRSAGILEHAFEVMNWSGMGHAEHTAALVLSPHALRIWRDRLNNPATKWTGDPCFI
ncbi:hypothetical protein [Mesorhizobium sp. M1348]|uniref:hypothetical protein n=1 Tax=unclassified Mesorhizobium TaxID=325217 RepID=UPI00333C2072